MATVYCEFNKGSNKYVYKMWRETGEKIGETVVTVAHIDGGDVRWRLTQSENHNLITFSECKVPVNKLVAFITLTQLVSYISNMWMDITRVISDSIDSSLLWNYQAHRCNHHFVGIGMVFIVFKWPTPTKTKALYLNWMISNRSIISFV